MQDGCDFVVGQLVEYRTWYDGDGAWISVEHSVGIVLEVISITEDMERESGYIELYDVKVYWITENQIETVPDLLLTDYNCESVVLNEQ